MRRFGTTLLVVCVFSGPASGGIKEDCIEKYSKYSWRLVEFCIKKETEAYNTVMGSGMSLGSGSSTPSSWATEETYLTEIKNAPVLTPNEISEGERVLRSPDLREIVSILLAHRQGVVTVMKSGKLFEFVGSPDLSRITAETLAIDAKLSGLSLRRVEAEAAR